MAAVFGQPLFHFSIFITTFASVISKSKSDALLEMIRNRQEMTSNQKMNLIVQLSIPSILSQISSILMFYIDASMVGSLGAEASAAIGLVESTMWLFGALTGAAAMGFSVQVAHFIGASDFRQAREVFRQGIMSSAVFSVVLGAIALAVAGPLPLWLGGTEEIHHDSSVYFAIFALCTPFMMMRSIASNMLKCAGNMRVPSILNVLMCVLDVIFNYICIFILHLGVLGAALGTALSFIIIGVWLMWFAVFRSSELSLTKEPGVWRFQWKYIRNALNIGSPMAAQNMLMSGAQIVSTMIVAPLGVMAIAANSFAVTAESLCYMPGYGIGEAATTLVGQSIGARQGQLARSFAHMTIFLGMAVMALMGVVMWIFAPEMIGFLSPVEEIRSLGTEALRIEAWAEPFFAAAIVSYSICIGAGDTFRPAMMNLGSMWLVRLTMAATLAPVYGLAGVWTAMAIELTFRGCIFLWRIFRGTWLKVSMQRFVANEKNLNTEQL